MAAKKAPKRGASRYQAPPPRKPLPGWAWLVCGLVIGAFGFFLFSLEPGDQSIKRPEKAARPEPARPASSDGQQAPKPKYDFYTLLPESEVILPPAAQEALTPPPAKPATPEEAAKLDAARAEAALRGETPPPAQAQAQTPAQVPATDAAAPTPPPASAKPAVPPPPPPATLAKAPTTQFFLQAGSFRKADEADRVRAQIIMLGHNVRVETGDVRGETWHRVLVGPYADQGRLTQAQKQLAAAGYSNLLPQKRQTP